VELGYVVDQLLEIVKAIEISSILKLLEGKEEGHKIEQELRRIEKRKEKVYVSNYTLLELAYLLEFVYGLSRERVAKVLKTLLEDPLFKVEEEEVWKDALKLYLEGTELLSALREVQYRRADVDGTVG
jgi:predicted nucleic-acid-binding protein